MTQGKSSQTVHFATTLGPLNPGPQRGGAEQATKLHKQHLPGLEASTPAPGQIFRTVALKLSYMPDVRKQKVLMRLKVSNMYSITKIPLSLLTVWLHSHSWGKNYLGQEGWKYNWFHIFHYLFILYFKKYTFWINLIFNCFSFTFYMQQNSLWCTPLRFDKHKQLYNRLHNQNIEKVNGFIFTTACTCN